jgi:hypothetical protein
LAEGDRAMSDQSDGSARLRGRHKIAVAHHCRLAVETMHPRFWALGPGGAYSTIVTVNSGYE